MKQQVNLYAVQFPKSKKTTFPIKYVLIAVLVIVGCLVGGGFVYLTIENKKEQLMAEKNLLDTATKNVGKLKQQKNNTTNDKTKAELSKLQDVLKQKQDMASQIEEQASVMVGGFSRRYIALARQDIKGLWLESIEFDGDADGVLLRGVTKSAALLTQYLQQLSKEPSFNGIVFRVLKIDGQDEEKNGILKFLASTYEVKEEIDPLTAILKNE